ncbi:MAG TPA: tetratricopeptide repeat protein, partial [Elusimicrobiales bacterium]|nr:tetratricopeptide repeat protein [Elusimicrobiales bacterium]
QTTLGELYYSGNGVPQDYLKASELTKLPAETGVPDAQFNLGVMYERGYGLAQDLLQAAYWYGKAAGQGHAGAQNNLGDSYYRGTTQQPNYLEACKWYTLAAAQHEPNAIKSRDAIQKEMAPDQIVRCQKAANEEFKKIQALKK